MLVLLAADVVGCLLGLLVLAEHMGFDGVVRLKEAVIIGWFVAACACFNYFLRLYHNLWQLVSLRDMFKMFFSVDVATLLLIIIGAINGRHPVHYAAGYLSFLSVYFLVMLSTRMVIRAAYRYITLPAVPANANRILLVGAGSAGEMVLREAEKNPAVGIIVGIVDDDPHKQNMYCFGKQVLGYIRDIPDICREYTIDEIIIAIPSASGKQVREWLELCSKTDCRCRIVPKNVMTAGSFRWQTIRQIEIEDLLDRPPVSMDDKLIGQFLEGQTVLVTGGGGSIGSELCRQIGRFPVKQLLIFDVYENNAYGLQQELVRTYPDLDLVVLIGSIRDMERLHQVFGTYRPTVVFHAAAHKHVPLMEGNPGEAIKNNVIGTWHVAQAATNYGVDKFILISTDKAVNPTNVMGCTKRLAEMIVQSQNQAGKTIFSAVRFGNVLGSNGSVVELFKKQIANGGPVTVTSEEIIRYFMTIPEAAQLVLQAGAMAKGSEIFVLDMGEPVKIIDLAKKMIRLSGFTPDVDIPIQIVGLRPGEKMYEELLHNSESDACTMHEKIYISQVEPVSTQTVQDMLTTLQEALEHPETDIRQLLQQLVPSYCPATVPQPCGKERLST